MFRKSLILGFGAVAPICLTGVWVFAGDHCSKGSAVLSSSAAPSCCAAKEAAATETEMPALALEVNAPSELATDAAQAPMGDSTVKGLVKFDGAAPTRESLNDLMKADAVCLKAHTDPLLKEDVIVGKDGGLKNVFVYVKKGADGKYEAPKDAFSLDQKGCVYVPHVFGVVLGQKVVVHNNDGTTHNIHTFPKRNKAINQAQPAGSKELELEMKTAEMSIPIKCDMHPWMMSVCYVVKNPFFAVTDDKGNFEIKNLPAGDYTFEAIHETLGAQTMDVKIAAKETKDANFTFKAK
jgi:plastocyanin